MSYISEMPADTEGGIPLASPGGEGGFLSSAQDHKE